jgi:putative sigma-54 modulation protein
MDLVIHYNHLDRSPSLDELIQEKSEKLLTKYRGEGSLTWNCTKEHHESVSHARLNLKGKIFNATSKSDDLYKTIDSNLEKIERQLERKF